MTLTFYGAAGGVTGSKHLLEVGEKRILLDCGIFQGLPDVKERNRSLPFAPDSIDQVVLSHAHIDHSGMLPLLVKRGFKGNILATPATKDVSEFMLNDMARIEVSDAEYRSKHKIGAPDEREPLFTPEDVEVCLNRFVPVPYVRDDDSWFEVTDRVRLKLYDAGHILGSAVIVLEIMDGSERRYLAFSGDMGPHDMPLLYNPEVPGEEVDTLILESTYGSRRHESLGHAMTRLAETINKVCDRGGKMIVPAFSLGRTQLLVYVLHRLTDAGRIPRFPIYVDSPLATNLTEVYALHRHDYDEETWADFTGPDHMPLAFRNLTYTQSRDESMALNKKKGPFMVVSASGMMTAGRVVHHLRHNISDENSAIFVTGYQARGTLGRRLLDGAKQVELLGDRFRVRADVFLFNEFSAHADRGELRDYAEALPKLQKLFLVHGEPHQADDLRGELAEAHPDWEVVRPSEGDTYQL